nr:hypothetical protein [Leisingera sp.]
MRVRHDNLSETDESFGIELFAPSSGVFTGSSEVLRSDAFILDDDGVDLDPSIQMTSTQPEAPLKAAGLQSLI